MGVLEPEWLTTDTFPSLNKRGVTVWRVHIAPPHPTLIHHLSADEQARAARFKSDRARDQFITSHAALRILCGHYLNLPPIEITFHNSAFNKPGLDNGYLYFNLAHSNQLALIAFSRHFEVGIDLEWIHPVPEMDEIAKNYFSPFEAAIFESLPNNLKQNAFFTCWTRKEAFIKAVGEGLSFPLNQFEVTLKPDEPARLQSIRGSKEDAALWNLCAFKPQQGYLAALAYQGPSMPVSFYDFSFASQSF